MQSIQDYKQYIVPAASTALATAQIGASYGFNYAKRIVERAFGERAVSYALQQKVFKSAGVYGGYRPYQREHIYRWQNRSERVQDWVRRREYKGYNRRRGYRRYQQKYKRYHRRYHRYYSNYNQY